MPPPKVIGIYPPDSVTVSPFRCLHQTFALRDVRFTSLSDPWLTIKDVAQSLAIDVLGTGAADLLAADVEYRIHLIVQEAKKFMVHGKRATLLPEDVEHAMEALNVEVSASEHFNASCGGIGARLTITQPVLVPSRPLPQPPFVAVPSTGSGQQLYHVADDEIDFSTYLKQPLPAGLASSAGVKWKAHWLAVEGVQPAIPENPLQSRAGRTSSPGLQLAARRSIELIMFEASRSAPTPATGSAALKASAKSQLPSDLQLYFTRLTTSLIPSSNAAPHLPAPPTDQNSQLLPDVERHRIAALASLREDTAIAGLLVYLVKWLNDSLSKCLTGALGTLGCLLDAVEAVLDNDGLFIEPYVSRSATHLRHRKDSGLTSCSAAPVPRSSSLGHPHGPPRPASAVIVDPEARRIRHPLTRSRSSGQNCLAIRLKIPWAHASYVRLESIPNGNVDAH